MVILDTNIIIDHVRQKSNINTILKQIVKQTPVENLRLSIISIQELYEGHSTLNSQAENLLLTTISSIKVLDYTYDIAVLAGKINRDLSRPIGFIDAAIAATVIINNCPLLTLNTKDFSHIPNLELYKL